MNKSVLLIFILLFSLPLAAQQDTLLNGRVVSGGVPIAKVFVINKKTATETTTDAQGNFTMTAKSGDVIVVYSNRTQVREFIMSALCFKDNPYVMEVKGTAYELDEVVITAEAVTSESLGIVEKGQKKYTPAEKRLATASNPFPELILGSMPGAVISTDLILNAISGRTKMLKKALAFEGKGDAINEIDGLYTQQELKDDLHIPQEYIQGFKFYVVEDAACAAALKSRNAHLAKQRLTELALKYVDLLNSNE